MITFIIVLGGVAVITGVTSVLFDSTVNQFLLQSKVEKAERYLVATKKMYVIFLISTVVTCILLIIKLN